MIPEEIWLPTEVTGARLLTDRRGCRLWRIELADGGVLALKYATGPATMLALREQAVMRRLGLADRIACSGTTSGGAWFASVWFDSPAIHELWRDARTSGGARGRDVAIDAAAKAAGSLRRLHGLGWRHADLQPAHILCPRAGAAAELLDYALAQGPQEVEPIAVYRGGLAHLAAPEVAAEILATPDDHHVTVTTAAEIYMFGAVLYTAWARSRPTSYEVDQPSTTQIHRAIADPARRVRPPEGWPRMAAAIEAMMAFEAGARPTADEVVGLLASVT